MTTQTQLVEVRVGRGSRIPKGTGQQCVVLGALLLGQLPFAPPNRFLNLLIPTAKVRLRFSPPPSPRSHTPCDTCCCMNKTGGRREVPESALMEAGSV